MNFSKKATLKKHPVLIKTLLNKCHPLKRFVYGSVSFTDVKSKQSILVEVIPRKNSKTICSCCGNLAPAYDRSSKPRRFQFVPLWGYQVYLLYFMRRVQCQCCGVKVEEVPWARGKSPLTKSYQLFLAKWARLLSWKETADAFRTSWGACL